MTLIGEGENNVVVWDYTEWPWEAGFCYNAQLCVVRTGRLRGSFQMR